MTDDWKRELIRSRLNEARESFADARLLMDKGGSIRAVINRLYYCLFYCVVALLQSRDLKSTKHSNLIGLFDVNFVKTGDLPKWMSQILHELFDLRMEIDYKISQVPAKESATELISEVQDFLLETEKFCQKDD